MQHEDIPRHFSFISRCLHWFMAALILAMLFIGVGMTTSLDYRLWLIDLHRPLGIALLVLVILRIINRFFNRPPALPVVMPRWQKMGAKCSHVGLYVLMVGLPVIGWAMLSASGQPIVMFEGVNLPAITRTSPVLYAWLRDLHGYLAWFLYFLVVGHISAALMHAWVRRDGVFSSMAKGGR